MPAPYSLVDLPPQVNTDYSGEASLTQQSFADDADINFIVRRYVESGFIADVNQAIARYDMLNTWVGDPYVDCVDKIVAARENFENLPSDLRARFNNNPQDMIAFLSASENEAEAIALGLLPSGEA